MNTLPSPVRHYHVGTASLSEERLDTMATLVGLTLRDESRALSNLVRREVEFALVEIIAGPPHNDGAFAFELRSAAGHVLGKLLFSATAVVAIADLMMGGLGAAEHRMPTRLEAEIAGSRLTSLAESLIEIVQGPSGPVVLDPVDEETLLLGDLVTVRFDVSTSDGRHPIEFAAPVRQPVTMSDDLDLVARTCADVPIEVRLQFKPIQLGAAEVASLSVGDVLCLDHELGDPLVGLVDGRPLLHTKLGRTRRAVAVQVVEILADEARNHDESIDVRETAQ